MNKVFKVTTILAALLLTSILAVEMLSATHTNRALQVSTDKAYVSNASPGTTTIDVTIVDDVRDIDDAALSGGEALVAGDLIVTNLTTEPATNTLDISLSASETSFGIWTAQVTINVTGTTTTLNGILANDGDQIQITYKNTVGVASNARSPNTDYSYVIVDATGPTIANTSPADAFSTNVTTPEMRADVSDAASGLGSTPGVAPSKANVEATTQIFVDGGPNLPIATDLTGGVWQASVTPGLAAGGHTWQVVANDSLGNRTESDVFDIDIDSSAPAFVSGTTGETLDVDDITFAVAPTDRKSIHVVFNDELDGASVAADGSDFQVQLVQGGTALSVAGAELGADPLNRDVFITLTADLAPDAEPIVTVIGLIDDEAGNRNTAGENVTLADGLSPAVTASLTVDAAAGTLTNDVITIRISSDESTADPAEAYDSTNDIGLAVRRTGADGSVTTSAALVGGTRTVVAAGTQWDWVFTFDSATADDDEGEFNVYARVADGAGNGGDVGVAGGAASDDMVLFEVDRGIPEPVISFSNDDPNSFVNLGFTGEASEYDGDTHSTVTAVTATVDGASVVVDTIDSITYTIAAPSGGWSVAAHDLDVTATDEAGNTVTFDLEFTIVARAEYSIALRPGLNLISLPGVPSSVDINDVIPATHAINQVFSYDPSKAGGWLVAERGDDGLFAGTLTLISSDLAYFVRTDTFDPLTVLVPRISAIARVLPPALSLSKGWNLVPVIDASGDLTITTIDAATYFATISPVRVYTLDVFGKLVIVDHTGTLTASTTDNDVNVGQGYWVYVTADSTLIP